MKRRSATARAILALIAPHAVLAGGVPPENRSERAAALPPATPPASATLHYSVAGSIKGIRYGAKSSLSWSNRGSAYGAQLVVKVMLLGSRVQTSAGVLNAQGLLPEHFVDRTSRERRTHFDFPQARIRFSNNAPPVDLQPGAQDRLSVFLQLAALLNARPEAYRAGQLIALQVAGTGDAEVWTFQVGEESQLELPAGNLKARLLARLPRSGHAGDSRVEVWLAPQLGHLPVRIRITEADGDSVDQRLNQMPA